MVCTSFLLEEPPGRRAALRFLPPVTQPDNKKTALMRGLVYPYQDSNLGLCLRRAALYPLSYRDMRTENCTTRLRIVKMSWLPARR